MNVRTIGFILIILAVPAAILVANLLWNWKRRRLAKERVGDIKSFINSFDGSGVDRDILVVVYKAFSESMEGVVDNFPVLPNDSIENIYAIDSEDLEDFMTPILEETGRSWDNYEHNPQRRVITVKDLAIYVNHQPVTSETSASD